MSLRTHFPTRSTTVSVIVPPLRFLSLSAARASWAARGPS
jgi:hypothetical protein